MVKNILQRKRKQILCLSCLLAISLSIVLLAVRTSTIKADYLPSHRDLFQVKEVDCRKLFEGSEDEMLKMQILRERYLKVNDSNLNETWYLQYTKNCDEFRRKRGYITSSLSWEEEGFPIAYSILVFQDIEMLDRLLRAIYRPQNHYCIHVDKKTNSDYYKAVEAIASCFPNIYLPSTRLDVGWATSTVLEADLVCMKELIKYKWKYFINLTGQEFPLKTNLELVKILTAFKGANNVEGTQKRARSHVWRNTDPPHDLRKVKGAVHVVINRHFVNYILTNQIASDVLRWTRVLLVPDEGFFSTLNYNPQLGIPGSYKGEPEHDNETKVYLARFKNWNKDLPYKDYMYPCAGRVVTEICILSSGDLPLLKNRKEFFANKFYLNEDRFAVGCLEEELFNRTLEEYLGVRDFNVSFYAELDYVKNQVEGGTI